MKIIGERLRGLRESVRLSQAKLAKEFDVSQSALARYEIDEFTPSPEFFRKYADYFDVSLDYVFGRTDDPPGMIYNNSSPAHRRVSGANLKVERFGEKAEWPFRKISRAEHRNVPKGHFGAQAEAAKRPAKRGAEGGNTDEFGFYHSRVVRMTRPRMRQGPVVRTMGV